MQKHSIETTRHTLAHVMAAAVRKMFPDAKFGIGPVIESGFYYDFDLPRKITENDFVKIEKEMQEIIAKDLAVEHLYIKIDEAIKDSEESGQKYKQELLKEIKKGERSAVAEEDIERQKGGKISFYKIGDFVDLCRGPHVSSTGELSKIAFTLDRIAGAYWRGNEQNPQLQRIYALAFKTKQELDSYKKLLLEAKARDHKKLGPELDLFTFSDLVGPGLPLWTPKGTMLRDILDNFVWQLRKKHGYEKVEIPHITKKELYEKSGHWDKFKDELFKITTREKHLFAMKPMNCPHHTQIYARKLWSYRELPQRYANTTMCYRDEQTGELAGLSRVRSFTQDDGHVFCREIQIKEEFLKIWDIIHEFYKPFGFELEVRISLHDPKHPEKYLGAPKKWEYAEKILKDIVKEKSIEAKEILGEAAFYGPKLDFIAKDSLQRQWQVATIQLDLNMPESFDLVCINEKGERERIVMIHAAIMGSIERFLSITIEHFAGAFPLWLSPIQISILPISEKQNEYANVISEKLEKKGFRVEVNRNNETVGKKIRETELTKVPYILIVGDKEISANSVSVRKHGQGDVGQESLEDFIKYIEKEKEGKI